MATAFESLFLTYKSLAVASKSDRPNLHLLCHADMPGRCYLNHVLKTAVQHDSPLSTALQPV